MLRLLQWLIFGHIHKWKSVRCGPVNYTSGSRGFYHDLECETCGKHKYWEGN